MAPDDRAGEALEHLQRAALELIHAARSTLDLIEDLVADPQSLAAVVSQVGHLAQVVRSAAAPSPTRQEDPERSDPPAPPTTDGVQRIPVN